MTESVDQKPLLVYDGDCDFCRSWIERWKKITGGSIEYEPYQTAAERFPHVSRREFSESVHLIMPSGEAFRGAAAVAKSLAYNPYCTWMAWTYRHVPLAAPVSEWSYRYVARHRKGFFAITRFLRGERK